MSNTQLYLAIGLPMLFSAAFYGLLWSHVDSQFAAIRSEIQDIRADIRQIRSSIELLTGKVYEMMKERP